METILLYVLKASGLMVAFYITYILLLRNETFFTSNRWFLITGLLTSLLLPIYFITKVVFIEKPKINFQNLNDVTTATIETINENSVKETFDWTQLIWIGYLFVVLFLLMKMFLSFISLYKMISKGQVIDSKSYKLIYVNENSAPFSFFNTIVINPKLYSEEEFESIICHEKIHCQEKHSIDVLVTKLICIFFWFNPFIWMYNKALLQNLEFIADQKATQLLENKNKYQKTLLKVVATQNCLSITNHFNKSLIKKRIVMLNTNPSQKINSWKYFSMLPLLVAFVFFFQVKVQAQVKGENKIQAKEVKKVDKTKSNPNDTENTLNLVIDKISSDIDLKGDSAALKERFNIDLKVNYIKRNAKGEIIELKLSYNDNKGKKGKTEQIRTIPIRPIFMKVYRKENGENEIGFYDNHEMKTLPKNDEKEKKITFIENLKDDAVIYVDDQFLMRKEDVQELDVNSLVSMKVLKDAKSLEKYNVIGKNEVVVIETNWTTKKPKTEDAKINYVIFTNDNGDELTYSFELNYFKVPQFPSVKITENSPILILNGVQQSNPLKTIDNIDFKKIKSVRVSNSKDEVAIGTPIEKIVITTN